MQARQQTAQVLYTKTANTWSASDGRADIITPYFGASGTGQLNAVFPVTPQSGLSVPAAQAPSAAGFQATRRL